MRSKRNQNLLGLKSLKKKSLKRKRKKEKMMKCRLMERNLKVKEILNIVMTNSLNKWIKMMVLQNLMTLVSRP